MESNVLYYFGITHLGWACLFVFYIKSSIFGKCFSELNKRQAEGNVNSHLHSRERSSNKPLSSCRSGLHKVIELIWTTDCCLFLPFLPFVSEHLIFFLSQSLVLLLMVVFWNWSKGGRKCGLVIHLLYAKTLQVLQQEKAGSSWHVCHAILLGTKVK